MNAHLLLYALSIANGTAMTVWDHLVLSSLERVHEAGPEGVLSARAALLEAVIAAIADDMQQVRT